MLALRLVLFPIGIAMVTLFGGLHVDFGFANRVIDQLDVTANLGLFLLWILGALGLAATVCPPVNRKLVPYYLAALAFLVMIWTVHAYRGELPHLAWEVPFLIAMTVGPVGTGLIFIRLAWRANPSTASA